MPTSHYTAPEMFLFTDTKFKQELNSRIYHDEETEKHVISMVVDGGMFCPTKKRQPTNGCEEGHNQRQGLTKGELRLKHKITYIIRQNNLMH